jgi:putative mRNA 3-end processing factor
LNHTIENSLSHSSIGLYCAAGDFYIDPKRKVHKALISHAHSDHAVPNSGNIYSTSGTRKLMLSRYRTALRSRFHDVAYRESFYLNEVKITFYPAGHILGSAQILMEYEGRRFLYTGDFKTQPDNSCENFELVDTDVLITETTFAHPDYSHPESSSEIKRLNEITEQNVMLGAYSIGKAQRLTQLISKHCPGKKILVQSEIARFHKVYESAGVDLGKWEIYSREEFKNESDCVYIVPPTWLSRNSRNKNIYKAFATGWKQYHLQCDAILQVSDHADWNDILALIEKIKPQKVYTLHGDGSHLKAHLKDKYEVIVLNH